MTREHGRVGMFAGLAGEPRRGIAGDGTHRPAHTVVLGVLFALAVVERAGNHGAVDIAVLKSDDHFLANAGDEVAAPVGAGHGRAQPHPGAGPIAGRGVVVAGRMGLLVVGTRAALPVELDLDAVIAVGMQRCACRADDDRALRATNRGLGVQAQAVAVGERRPKFYSAATLKGLHRLKQCLR